MPYTKSANLFGGYDIPSSIPGMGCSSIVNADFAVRNYDFSPLLYDKRLVVSQTNECFASVGHSLHVNGRHEGVNEKGLFIAFHFVNQDQAKLGLLASTIIRIVLDICTDTYEAIALLKALPHTWSYNFSIGDTNGRKAIVEASPTQIKVREGGSKLTCTNHFQHKDLLSLNRIDDYTLSFHRLKTLEKKASDEPNMEEVVNWFGDPSADLFFNDYENFFGTLHTFAYSFKYNQVITTIARGDMLCFNWGDWLNKRDLLVEVLSGKLNQKPIQ